MEVEEEGEWGGRWEEREQEDGRGGGEREQEHESFLLSSLFVFPFMNCMKMIPLACAATIHLRFRFLSVVL